MAGEAILVVDDNTVNLKLMRALLVSDGYVVWTAADAVAARRVLADHQPKLILMDLQLPGMDGLELTRQLKAAPETAGITIVAMTAYAMIGDEDRARSSGCDGYLTKPIDTRQLLAAIRGYLA